MVYIYNKKTNQKIETIKDVYRIASKEKNFHVYIPNDIRQIPKDNIKLIVYAH